MMCILRNLVMKFPFNWSCSRHIRIFSLNMDWSIDVTKIHVNNISTDIMQKLNTSKWHSRSISISLFCGIITSTSISRFVIRFAYFFLDTCSKSKISKENLICWLLSRSNIFHQLRSWRNCCNNFIFDKNKVKWYTK